MASVYTRKDSPYFWLSYRDDAGVWKNKSTGVRLDAPSGKRQALKKAQEETANESDLHSPVHGQALDHWVPAFIKNRYESRQPKAFQRYNQCWSAVAIYLKGQNIATAAQVTKKVAKDYAYWRINPPVKCGVKKAKWNTAILEIKFLALIMDEAVDRGYITGNPCVRLGLKRERTKEKIPFSIEEEEIVKAKLIELKAPEWMRISWAIAIRQGCRISETQVPLERIDLQASPPTITFSVKRDRHGERFHVAPLHPDLVPLMRRFKKEKRQFTCELPPSPWKVWHKWFRKKEVGLFNHSFHDSRVTVVTRLSGQNFSQPMVKDYVGHASTTVNDVYRKLKPRDLVGLSESLGGEKVEIPDVT